MKVFKALRNLIFGLMFLLPSTVFAEDITIRVNGMVCAFCASGIEKTFNSNKAVESVDVDLDTKIVKVSVKDNATLSDEELTKMIVQSGYSVVAIERK